MYAIISVPDLRPLYVLCVQLWPVRLQYDHGTGAITECCLVTHQHSELLWRDGPSVRSSLLDWAEQRRWDTFLQYGEH